MSGDRTALTTRRGLPEQSFDDDDPPDEAWAPPSMQASSATVCVLGDTTILMTSSDQTSPPNMWLRITSMSDDGKKIMICFSLDLSCFRDGSDEPVDGVNILLHAIRAPNAWNKVVTSCRLSARSRYSKPCNHHVNNITDDPPSHQPAIDIKC